MPISSISGASAPVKTETSEAQLSSEASRNQARPVDKPVRQPEIVDEKVNARVAANEKQVSQPEQNNAGGESSNQPKRPRVSNEINYAVTQQKLSENSPSQRTSSKPKAEASSSNSSSSSDNEKRIEAADEAANRQTRADSARQVANDSRPSKAEF